MKKKCKIRSGSKKEINRLAKYLVVAIDLGFSKSKKSCGVAWKDGKAGQSQSGNFRFGECINKVCCLLKGHSKAVLIIEAPLSGVFSESGNPVERGDFERQNQSSATVAHRYWYSGPGAAMCLAAVFFLQELVCKLPKNCREVVLYEGFLTFKRKAKKHSCDAKDAKQLLNCFLHAGQRRVTPIKVPKGGSVITGLGVVKGTEGAVSESIAPAIIAPK